MRLPACDGRAPITWVERGRCAPRREPFAPCGTAQRPVAENGPRVSSRRPRPKSGTAATVTRLRRVQTLAIARDRYSDSSPYGPKFGGIGGSSGFVGVVGATSGTGAGACTGAWTTGAVAGGFLAGAFLAGACLAGAFWAGALRAGAFFAFGLAEAFFLAGTFLATAFLAEAFFAGAFLVFAFLGSVFRRGFDFFAARGLIFFY
jgi:hypothetical protein